MLQIGDAVLLKVPKIDKLSSYYDPRPYIITAVKGTMITARRGERSVTRNSSFFKPIVQQLGQPIITHSGQSMDLSDGEDDIIQLDQHQPANVAAPQQQPPQQPAAPPARNAAAAPLARTRPQRQKQLPVKLTDYIMT
jgi:predicted ABC-class ATPase